MAPASRQGSSAALLSWALLLTQEEAQCQPRWQTRRHPFICGKLPVCHWSLWSQIRLLHWLSPLLTTGGRRGCSYCLSSLQWSSLDSSTRQKPLNPCWAAASDLSPDLCGSFSLPLSQVLSTSLALGSLDLHCVLPVTLLKLPSPLLAGFEVCLVISAQSSPCRVPLTEPVPQPSSCQPTPQSSHSRPLQKPPPLQREGGPSPKGGFPPFLPLLFLLSPGRALLPPHTASLSHTCAPV